MSKRSSLQPQIKLAIIGAGLISVVLLSVGQFLYGQNKLDFPDGYDAVQAAPNSHKVIFENTFVRVLEVIVPPPGSTVPRHHHRWPSLVLDWDTGGASPHVRYHGADGTVRDIPSKVTPLHAGVWVVHWMEPEALHSIDVIDLPKTPGEPSDSPPELRIEFKTHP
jgi:hypothetical protein